MCKPVLLIGFFVLAVLPGFRMRETCTETGNVRYWDATHAWCEHEQICFGPDGEITLDYVVRPCITYADTTLYDQKALQWGV